MPGQPLFLQDLTWPELEAALPKIELVLVPVGSTEQHGPNLAMSCDTTLADKVCARLEQLLRPRVLVAPAIPYGISHHHMGFCGTVTLHEQTLISIVKDVVTSLMQHGLQRFVLLNGHGGNNGALGIACAQIERELEPTFIAACTYYSAYDPAIDQRFADCGKGGHACGMETSLALELAPDLVRTEALADIEPGPRYVEGNVVVPLVQRRALQIPYRYRELTRNGAMGDARKARPEYGKAMVDSVVEQVTGLIELAIARPFGAQP